MEQCAVGIDAAALCRDDFMFGDEGQVGALAPAFEQILECFAQQAFTAAAGDLAQPIEFGAIFVDQLAAHADLLARAQSHRQRALTHKPPRPVRRR